ncbi:glycosyltransferase [candidate division KSB1 bacterium]
MTLFSLSDRRIRDSELREYGDYCSRIEIVYLPRNRSYLQCLAGLAGRRPLQVYYYHTKEMERLISKEINSFDLVFVHLIRMAEYVKDYLDISKVIDFTDAISLNYQRSIRYQKGFRYLISLIEQKRVLRYEIDIISSFDKNLFVSEVDKTYIEQYTDAGNIDVIPAGVDTDYFSYCDSDYEANEIVFVGNMRTYPNSDAAYYFAKKIFPMILQKVPDARFTISGAYPTRSIRSLNGKGNIFVTGRVEDVRPYLKKAAVSVCPMRAGAGVQNKVIESMASGTPVVTSLIGSEGIGAVSGRDILIAENEQDFAEKVTTLMNDKELREKISRSGRKFIEEKFADTIAADKFQCMIAGFQNK